MSELHETDLPQEDAASEIEHHNTRLGLGLFAVYLLGYGVYVIMNAFWPKLMAADASFGLNVAVVYGLGLIIGAFALALAYALLCRSSARKPS